MMLVEFSLTFCRNCSEVSYAHARPSLKCPFASTTFLPITDIRSAELADFTDQSYRSYRLHEDKWQFSLLFRHFGKRE